MSKQMPMRRYSNFGNSTAAIAAATAAAAAATAGSQPAAVGASSSSAPLTSLQPFSSTRAPAVSVCKAVILSLGWVIQKSGSFAVSNTTGQHAIYSGKKRQGMVPWMLLYIPCTYITYIHTLHLVQPSFIIFIFSKFLKEKNSSSSCHCVHRWKSVVGPSGSWVALWTLCLAIRRRHCRPPAETWSAGFSFPR